MDMPATHSDASSMPLRFQALPGDGRVAFAAEACIAARSLPSACQRCAQACPVGAVGVGEAGPELVAGCLGCGRCAAACPTGAITLEGFSGAVTLPPGNAPLRIECWKVRESFAGRSALRVPCLGGIGIEQVLEWLALPDDRPLQFVDRGWCGKCQAGGALHPALALIEEICRVLDACGHDASERISLVSEPLPLRLMPETIPEPATQEKIGRRDFFRRFAAEAAAALPAAPRPVAPRLRRGSDFPLPKRERILAALTALTREPVERLPAAVLPGLTLSGSCDHLGVCAGMCPTGALYLYEEDGHAGAAFDPRDCVACGLCAQACPAHAIEVRPAGSPDARAIEQVLTRFPLVRCEGCLTLFAATQGFTLCPACRRNRQMTRQLFGTHIASAQSSQ
jgi:ferredoxin